MKNYEKKENLRKRWKICLELNSNSVHHTFNRFINIHGTDEAIMRNNVGYDAVGHGYFLEDGIERNGLLILYSNIYFYYIL